MAKSLDIAIHAPRQSRGSFSFYVWKWKIELNQRKDESGGRGHTLSHMMSHIASALPPSATYPIYGLCCFSTCIPPGHARSHVFWTDSSHVTIYYLCSL